MSRKPTRSERVRQLIGEAAHLLGARRPGEAVPLLLEARKLAPADVAAAINLGGAYIMQGKYDEAVPVLESATRLEPDNAMIWSNLAAAYLGALHNASPERQDKAIGAYERALTLDPAAPHAHYNLGLIYLQRRDPQRAGDHFLAALQNDPNDRDARYYLNRLQRGEHGAPET